MKTAIEEYIVNINKTDWQPLIENGHEYKGIFVKSLRYDETTKRSPSIFLKFEPGAAYPYHNHPGGEELFVIKGNCFVNEAFLEAGDYLYTPRHFKHGVRTENGCELLFLIPEEVEIVS